MSLPSYYNYNGILCFIIINPLGQKAMDLCHDVQMSDLLNVKPLKEILRAVQRFEGPISKV